MLNRCRRWSRVALFTTAFAAGMQQAVAAPAACLFNDAHFHLTNYVQKGTDAGKYVDEIMGDKVGRSTLFGIPLATLAQAARGGVVVIGTSQKPRHLNSAVQSGIATMMPAMSMNMRVRIDSLPASTSMRT